MDDERPGPQESPAKRQRTLACQRCRSRKQKCEDTRPCSNCLKSGEECFPTRPAPRPNVDSEYIRLLEKRIAELESPDPQQSLDHLSRINSRDGEELQDPLASSVVVASDDIARDPTSSPVIHRPAMHRQLSKLSDSSPGHTLPDGTDDADDLNHLLFGLIASPSAQPLPATQHPAADDVPSEHTHIATLPPGLEHSLLDAYRERAQAQYPFFHWDTFTTWNSEWNNCLPCDLKQRSWQGFFVNLVYATSLLLLRKSHAAAFDGRSFYINGIALLPAVFQQPDKLLHIQAYLLLSVHALHQSSTERIISLTSTAIRQCIQQQLHLGETEPISSDIKTRLKTQVRRRCFWCAYLLDRLVMSAFDLPPTIPDPMITVRPFANIEDRDLLSAVSITPPNYELADSPNYTCMSSALHILQCRRIQSEISAITLRWDYAPHFENSSDWRIRILAELENYKARVQNFSDPQSKGYTSQRWQAMIYHYTLLMLYRPTKDNVMGSAGDWSVQASTQACLMFRRTQIDRQIAQPWLALLVQFQSGITLLYCFWATAPSDRTANFDSLDVPDALRACSNILAIMADRWESADCLRDVFELLAREIPLIDRPNNPPTRLTEMTMAKVQAHLPQIRALVVHRPVLRMIEEMISEDFPRAAQPRRPPSVAGMLGPTDGQVMHLNPTVQQGSDIFQMPFSIQQPFVNSGANDMQTVDAYGLLSFPGVFDLDTWT